MTSSCSSMKLMAPSPTAKAVIWRPFLMSWTLTHFLMAELGCLASIPTFSRTIPRAWADPSSGSDFSLSLGIGLLPQLEDPLLVTPVQPAEFLAVSLHFPCGVQTVSHFFTSSTFVFSDCDVDGATYGRTSNAEVASVISYLKNLTERVSPAPSPYIISVDWGGDGRDQLKSANAFINFSGLTVRSSGFILTIWECHFLISDGLPLAIRPSGRGMRFSLLT